MRVHLKGDTCRLERLLAGLEKEVVNTKSTLEVARRELERRAAEDSAIPMPRRVPLGMLLAMDRAKRFLEHAEYCYEKALDARNAVRSLAIAGAIEV